MQHLLFAHMKTHLHNDSCVWKIEKRHLLQTEICAILSEVSWWLCLCECVQFAEDKPWPSEAHAHPPRVVSENFVFFLHDACVCAFVDGVGHYSNVVIFQGDVVWVRELQQLPVFVPARMGVRR